MLSLKFRTVIAILLATFFYQYLPVEAAVSLKESTPSADVSTLHRELKANRDDLEAVRRDQLNYKVEKDLLKEAYSSNIQTINLVLTMVLGVFAILGYLGFKGVLSLKSEYSKELEELRNLRIKLEVEITGVVEQQKSFKTEVGNLTKTNEEQDRRLKVLEISEKVGQYLNARNYSFALDFANVGLAIDSENIKLLGTKIACHGKLGEFASAISTANRLLELSPEDEATITNLAEYYLLANQVEEFDKFYLKHKTLIDKHYKGALLAYLKVLRAFIKADIVSLKSDALPFVESCNVGAAARMGSWQYDEFQHVANAAPESPIKTLTVEFVKFLSGIMPTEALVPLLK